MQIVNFQTTTTFALVSTSVTDFPFGGSFLSLSCNMLMMCHVVTVTTKYESQKNKFMVDVIKWCCRWGFDICQWDVKEAFPSNSGVVCRKGEQIWGDMCTGLIDKMYQIEAVLCGRGVEQIWGCKCTGLINKKYASWNPWNIMSHEAHHVTSQFLILYEYCELLQ